MKAGWLWMLGLVCLSLQAAETPVSIDTGKGTLAATLSVPDKACPCAAVLLIAGSGPTDRDGNSAVLGLHTNAYRQLAQALADAGIASLRYDKRGVAGSTAANPGEDKLVVETFVQDAQAALRFLQQDGRFPALAVAGHSEGALIGMLATKGLPVRAFVSIAGLGRSAADALRQQLAGKLMLGDMATNERILSSLERGQVVPDVPAQLQALYRPAIQGFLISWFHYQPTEEIARLDMPVLIVQGDRDIQVSLDDADRLSAAKPSAERLIVAGMTHTLKQIDGEAQQRSTYSDPALPLAPALKTGLIDFLQRQLRIPANEQSVIRTTP